MPNPFDELDAAAAVAPAETVSAQSNAKRNPFDELDAADAAAAATAAPAAAPGNVKRNALDAAANFTWDETKRFARGAVGGASHILEAVNSATGFLRPEQKEMSPEMQKAYPRYAYPEFYPGEIELAGARTLKKQAAKIPVDPARNQDLSSALAEGAGEMVPSLLATVANPVAGVVVLAGQEGERARDAALEAGDTPELAAQKAKLARVGGGVMAVPLAAPVRGGASLLERWATRGVETGLINSAQDLGTQKLIEQKQNIDWGRAGRALAGGIGMGLAIGGVEALAFRKAFGTKKNLEGKTVQQAVNEVADEMGTTPAEIQDRINQMMRKEPTAATPPPTEIQDRINQMVGADATGTPASQTALRRQLELEQAFGGEAEVTRLQKQDERAQALTAARAEEVKQGIDQGQLAGDENTVLSGDEVSARRARIETQPGESARERARLEAASPETPAAADEPLPALSPQAQRMYDEHGFVNIDALLPLARSVVGGAVGYATGDTPEERLRNTLVGMGLGAAASPALARRLLARVRGQPESPANLGQSEPPQHLLDAYRAKEGTEGGRYISTDLARSLIPGYDPRNPTATHEQASAISNSLYRAGLDDPNIKKVVILAGGGGSGKSASRRGAAQGEDTMTLDTVFGSKSAAQKLDDAVKAGKQVQIAFTHRDVMDSVGGMIGRIKGDTPPVPSSALVRGHFGARKNFLEAVEKYGDNPNVVFTAVDNNHGLGNARDVSDPARFLERVVANSPSYEQTLSQAREHPALEQLPAEFHDAYLERGMPAQVKRDGGNIEPVSGGGPEGSAGGTVGEKGGNNRLGSNRGSIDPEVLYPVARAAIGGALGYATGDTPEERVRNALLGMGFGASASPALVKKLTARVLNTGVGQRAAQLAENKLTQLRLSVAPQSLLPREIRNQLRFGEQASNAVTQTGLGHTRDLERAIASSGNLATRGQTAGQVKDFLDGKIPASALPNTVRSAAEKVRLYIDSLSDRAVSEGVVSGKLASTFLENKGSYLRRSYDIFLNPDYKPKPAAVQNAIGAVQQANGISRAEAEGIVAGILDKNSRAGLGDFLLGRGKIAGKDVSSLVKRQDLLPEIRTLLGEVKDPLLAANQTIPRMAKLIENDAAQKQVRAIGQRLGLFKDTRSLEHPTPLVAEGSTTHDNLAGLYAAPEIAAAFQKEAGSGRAAFVPEMLWKAITSASAVAKTAKTVWNPESYAPNFLGGIIANLGNGNFRYNHAARGLALGAEELGAMRQFHPNAPSRPALQAELHDLRKLGIIGESVNAQDFLRTVQSSYFGGLKDKATSVLKAPSKLYGATDDFNRYVAWQSEKARYAKAFPEMTPEQLNRHAAEVVRATTPIYSEVPKVVKQLSVAGLTPSFVNFSWEVFRNTKNSFQIALRDIKQGRATDNAALVKAGAARLASISAVVGASSMFGLSKLSRQSHNVTDEQDKAVRYFSPPWNRDGMLQYHNGVNKGEPVQVSNLSYLVPHALLFQAAEAARRAEPGQGVPEFLRAMNEQFGMGNSVLIPPVAGAITGFDPKTGRSIPKTAVEPTFADRAKYLGGEAFKPLVADWVDKFQKARAGEKGAYGRVYSEKEQLGRLLGVRAQTLDPGQAVAWKARELGNGFQEAADIYRLRQKQQLAPAALQEAYQNADTARKGQFDEMARMVAHARSLGVDDEKTIAALRAARVPPESILGVLEGRYTPLAKDQPKTIAEYFAELQARPAEQRGAALAQLFRQDPAIAKGVVERFGATAKGVGERDKLLLGLGVGDGERANYLRRRLQEMETGDQRRAYLLELRRKGILTERVLEQMTKPPAGAR